MAATCRSLYESVAAKTTLSLTRRDNQVSIKNDKLIVERGDQGKNTIEIELDRIRRIMIFGLANADCKVLTTLMHQGVPVDFFDVQGLPKGQLNCLYGSEDLHLSWQQRFDDFPDRKFELARKVLRAKADNSANILLRRTGLCPEWNNCSDLFQKAENPDQLRGAEGYTARTYYGQWNTMLEEGQWKGRLAHPAPDPLNAMLSFGYVMLHNRFASALRSQGLNPRMGFFHRSQGGHWALASDLMEPFRPLVDHVVLKLVRHHEVHLDKFEIKDGRCLMKDPHLFGTVLKAFENMFSCTIKLYYQLSDGLWTRMSRTLDDHIEDQATAYAGMLGGQCDFEPLRINPCCAF